MDNNLVEIWKKIKEKSVKVEVRPLNYEVIDLDSLAEILKLGFEDELKERFEFYIKQIGVRCWYPETPQSVLREFQKEVLGEETARASL